MDIAETKTLADMANHIAMSASFKLGSPSSELAPILDLGLLPAANLDTVLQATEAGEIWDIGQLIAKQLSGESVVNVLQLFQVDLATIHRRWGVVLGSGNDACEQRPSMDRQTHGSVEVAQVHFQRARFGG